MDIIEQMAHSVYSELGSGHSEAVYQKACEVFLRLAGIHYDTQADVAVFYQGHQVGRGIMDLVLFGERKTIIELKAVSGKIGEAEMRQVRNYIRLANGDCGCIVNFGQPGANRQGEVSIVRVEKYDEVGTESDEKE